MKKLVSVCIIILMGSILGANPLPSPQWDWVRSAGGSVNDEGVCIATTNAGSSFVAGNITDVAGFSPPCAGGRDVYICLREEQGSLMWVKRAGGPGDDTALGIAYDNLGNCYVTGYFEGTADFGSTVLTSDGDADIFICKLGFMGTFQWAKQAGGLGRDEGHGISVDSEGNCFVSGYFAGTASFGSTTLNSVGDKDVCFAKLDSSGNWLWAKRGGCPGDDSCTDNSLDGSGNSYVSGWFSDTAVFGSIILTSSGNSDIFVAKLDAEGNWLWAKRTGGAGDDSAYDIFTAANGTSYIAGSYQYTMECGNTTLTSNGMSDACMLQIDSEGNWQRGYTAGSSSNDAAFGICFGVCEKTYALVSFNITAVPTIGQTSTAVLVIDSAGISIWSFPVGYISGNGEDIMGYGMSRDANDNLYITGGFFGSIFFRWPDMYEAPIEIDSNGEEDMFVAEYFTGDIGLTPVELSSFSATITAQNNVQVTWVSQSETAMLGYRVYRNTSGDQSASALITPVLIPATNTSSQQIYNHTDSEVIIGQTYYYWLESAEITSSEYYGPVSVTVEGYAPPVMPEITTLINAYPNPIMTGDIATIKIALRAGENGSMSIYNLRGQKVRCFNVVEGSHTIIWDGKDSSGNPCGMGVYHIRLTTPSMNQSQKIVILK